MTQRRRADEGEVGIVGANLAITLAFALFAVIQLNVSKNRSFDVVNRLEKRLERLDGSTKALPERLALYRAFHTAGLELAERATTLSASSMSCVAAPGGGAGGVLPRLPG